MVIDHALVDNDDEIRWRLIGGARDDVAQEEVRGREYAGCEEDRVLEVDANFLPDDIHINAGACSRCTANSRASDAARNPSQVASNAVKCAAKCRADRGVEQDQRQDASPNRVADRFRGRVSGSAPECRQHSPRQRRDRTAHHPPPQKAEDEQCGQHQTQENQSERRYPGGRRGLRRG